MFAYSIKFKNILIKLSNPFDCPCKQNFIEFKSFPLKNSVFLSLYLSNLQLYFQIKGSLIGKLLFKTTKCVFTGPIII